MAMFDLSTPRGLRDACRESEHRLVADPEYVEKVETTARFLREVHEAPDEERQSEIFLRRVWDESPLFGLGHGDFDVSAALANSDFRREFHALTTEHLPAAPGARAVRMDEILNTTIDLVQRFVAPDRSGRRLKPLIKTRRVFATLFPHDFTTLRYPEETWALYKHLGGRARGRPPAQAHRRILDRLVPVRKLTTC